MLEVFDDFYSLNLSQEVTRGMREVAQRGFWLASHQPYGFKKVKVAYGAKERWKLEVDEERAHIVRRMFEKAGRSDRAKKIATDLNADGVPSPERKKVGQVSSSCHSQK